MQTDKGKVYPIWIDETNKIISFKQIKGFELIRFSSKEEKTAFVVEKSYSGYRFQ